MKKWSGISIKCSSLNLNAALDFSEFDDDIVGPKLESKALYWIECTLEDEVKLEKTIYNLLELWISSYSSNYMMFTVDGYGDIQITKKYRA